MIQPLTKQEIFNKVWEHFVINEQPLSHTETQCRYRNGNAKCAIGIFIPDEYYQLSIEGNGVSSLKQSIPYMEKLFEKVDEGFLCELQRAHDDASLALADTTMDLKSRLLDIANEHQLTIP